MCMVILCLIKRVLPWLTKGLPPGYMPKRMVPDPHVGMIKRRPLICQMDQTAAVIHQAGWVQYGHRMQVLKSDLLPALLRQQ